MKFNEVAFGKHSTDTKYHKSKSNCVTKEILNLIYTQQIYIKLNARIITQFSIVSSLIYILHIRFSRKFESLFIITNLEQNFRGST